MVNVAVSVDGVTSAWGLLGPEVLASTRRTRSLGLASVVRHYNELAVPGMGNVWFVRQIYLALLGIVVAERVRAHGKAVSNIEVSNTIEALACWLALRGNNWASDARLRGRTKLAGREDVTFASLSRRSAYVTQPMRMSAVQPLPALGLVRADSERFNAYVPTDAGFAFIEAATAGIRPWKSDVVTHLVRWVSGDRDVDSPKCRKALSPLEPVAADARALLANHVLAFGEGAPRRRAVVAWAHRLRTNPRSGTASWQRRPSEIEVDHWQDLASGAMFFRARDEALALLDQVEARLDQVGAANGMALKALAGKDLSAAVARLRESCQKFLDMGQDVSPQGMAGTFCRECLQGSPQDAIRALVGRDGQVLRVSGDTIRPGPAFRHGASAPPAAIDDAEAMGDVAKIRWPEAISGRVPNLFYLSADLDGELEAWREMSRSTEEGDDER